MENVLNTKLEYLIREAKKEYKSMEVVELELAHKKAIVMENALREIKRIAPSSVADIAQIALTA